MLNWEHLLFFGHYLTVLRETLHSFTIVNIVRIFFTFSNIKFNLLILILNKLNIACKDFAIN